MTIEWFGNTCVRLTASGLTIVIDPFGPASGLRPRRLNADLLLLTGKDGDRSVVAGQPFIVDGPGEYEVRRAFVYGIPTQMNGGDRLTMYFLEVEGVSLAHLGSLGHQLTNGELERLEGVDVLFVPVGGHGVLNADQASELISAVEPRVVIPTSFRLPGLKKALEPVSVFAKEMGVKESTVMEKYKVSTKDLPQDTTQVVILQP